MLLIGKAPAGEKRAAIEDPFPYAPVGIVWNEIERGVVCASAHNDISIPIKNKLDFCNVFFIQHYINFLNNYFGVDLITTE